jgi:hypothetical protein
MEKQSIIRTVLVVFIATAVNVGFWAVPQAFAQQGPCADDAAKFCKDVQPGQGRIIKCMKEHENELSTGCKQHLAQVAKRGREAREACQDDVFRFCGNVQPGGGRIALCLKEHAAELTPQCKAKIDQARQRRGQ